MRIPIWGEARVALEHAALRAHPVFRGQGVARGSGQPVLLVPGFLAGDASLSLMAGWLKRLGYRPCRGGMYVNVDCTARAVQRLEAQLESIVERRGRMVTVVGQSRGGSMARVLAVRRPELIEAIICLGSPVLDPLAVHPFVRAQVVTVAALGSLGVPGLFSRRCRSGGCCERVREDTAAPFPAGVRFSSVYSRSDGVVDWRSCLDPFARHVEVRSSHIGMAVNAAVFGAVAEALADRGARGGSGVRITEAAA